MTTETTQQTLIILETSVEQVTPKIRYLSLQGEISLATIEQLSQNLNEWFKSNPNSIIKLNLEKIVKLDSSLIALLLDCKRNNKTIELINLPENLIRLIEIYGIDSFFLTEEQKQKTTQ